MGDTPDTGAGLARTTWRSVSQRCTTGPGRIACEILYRIMTWDINSFQTQELRSDSQCYCFTAACVCTHGGRNAVHHDDVIKWKHFPRYWPFVWEIHRSPVNFPHKGQWRGALMFILICARMNDWVNNREAGDLRRYLVHYDVIVMTWSQ